jgi:hypothetical protein
MEIAISDSIFLRMHNACVRCTESFRKIYERCFIVCSIVITAYKTFKINIDVNIRLGVVEVQLVIPKNEQ